MTTKYIAYTRVSTTKQGATGVSLVEQKRFINHYAQRRGLEICTWYEEQQTAARKGRPIFDLVVEQLKQSEGSIGLILHKVDRGARNLRDWASIGEAIDQGVDVRFAHDDIDMHTRGGRLTADIQAVIAADYIRNLREEVKKGINGRLSQGLYPFQAMRGYRDTGSGQVKQPNPAIAPLIILAFQLYATGRHSLNSLRLDLHSRGLMTSTGRPLSPGALSKLLHNPFYKGTISVGGRLYSGKHQPLVSEDLFGRVQDLLHKRKPKRERKHRFRYRHSLRCRGCKNCLIGEKQKQFIYYRCHSCPGVCVREDRVSKPNHRFERLSRQQIKEVAN